MKKAFAATENLDLQSPKRLAELSEQLALQKFDFSHMLSRDVAELFVAVHTLEGQLTGGDEVMAKLQHQIGLIDEALGRHMPDVNFDTLNLLLKASPLSREAAESLGRSLREAMSGLQAMLMLELMGPMRQAIRDKSPSAISAAIEAAKQRFAELDRVAGLDLSELEKQNALKAALHTALTHIDFIMSAVELRLIFEGTTYKMVKGQAIAKNAPNAVSRAVAQEISGNAETDREILNLKLLHGAVTRVANMR